MHYWEESCLKLIASMLGKVIRVDNATFNKDKMMFARVLVEMNIKHGLYDTISFTNEDDELVNVKVAYDWKPTVCTKCNQLGHLENVCRVGMVQKWVPKPTLAREIVDEQGFQMVRPRNKGKSPTIEEERLLQPDY